MLFMAALMSALMHANRHAVNLARRRDAQASAMHEGPQVHASHEVSIGSSGPGNTTLSAQSIRSISKL